MKKVDKIYARKRSHVVDFVFDEKVANVFPDMIRRSVPGYEAVISLLGVIAEQYVVSNSNVYDLGCSLGASLFSVYSRLPEVPVNYIGVDSSEDMLTHCRHTLVDTIPQERLSLIHREAQQVEIGHASLVMMNFTLQFLPVSERPEMIRRIFNGLLPGGALVVSEKLAFEDEQEKNQFRSLHEQFKSSNGYSDLEISQKRTALEDVMRLDHHRAHESRLKAAGFSSVITWFQCMGFCSYLAVK